MENRRQTYRHFFEPHESLGAELLRPGQRVGIKCEVHNLSVGGMRVRWREQVTSLADGDTLVVRLLGRETPPLARLNLTIPAQIITLNRCGEEWVSSIRFLPIADPRTHDNLERTLSSFLLAEQRRKKAKES